MGKFFKLAVGPATMTTELGPGIAAKYIQAKELLKLEKSSPQGKAELAQVPSKWRQKGILLTSPMKIPDMPNASGKDLARSLKRHELTHYIRSQKGKLDHIGKPSIKGVLHSVREEVAAYRGQTSRLNVPRTAKLKGTAVGVIGSVKALYPKGVLKTIIRKGK